MAQSSGTGSIKNTGGRPAPNPMANRSGSNSMRVSSGTGPTAASGGRVTSQA